MKISVWILCFVLGPLTAMAATPQSAPIPGRLFYTPAQRSMLNEARVRKVTDHPKMSAPAPYIPTPAPVSFDGMITRSDGVATHWVNGRPHVGRSSDKVHNLKPGQTRAAQKVYESYQIRQPEAVRVPATPTAPPGIKPAKPEEFTP